MKTKYKRMAKVSRFVAPEEPDRLSDFTDGILTYILSFLPSKYAVRTSCLSSRWKDLYLGVPIMSFVDYDTHVRHVRDLLYRRLTSTKAGPLTDFRLTYPKCKPCHFRLWCMNNSIPPPPPRRGSLPTDTLIYLTLCGEGFVLELLGEFCFPNLKELYLEELKIIADSNSFRFAESYPVIEKIWMRGITFTAQRDAKLEVNLGILSRTMKYLVIKSRQNGLKRIQIDAPKLELLELVNKIDGLEIHFCKTQSLMAAEILQFDRSRGYIKLLSQINNVKYLNLAECEPQEMISRPDSLPMFISLMYLEILARKDVSMWSLLQRAPNLEELIYDYWNDQLNHNNNEQFLPPKNVPRCLARSLKRIKIRNFGYFQERIEIDVEMVRYLLHHGGVLEKMTIEHDIQVNAEWLSSALIQIPKLPRRSLKCEIVLKPRSWLLEPGLQP